MRTFHLLFSVAATTLASVAAVAQSSPLLNCGPASQNNTCSVDQGQGTDNLVSGEIIGSANAIVVNQAGSSAVISRTHIAGDANRVRHEMSGIRNSSDSRVIGNWNSSYIAQLGTENTAREEISGEDNQSFIAQVSTEGKGNFGLNSLAGNSVSGTILQDQGSASAHDNYAVNNLRASAARTNSALVPNQTSVIEQSERGNVATVVLRGGDATVSGRGMQSSFVHQSNSIFTTSEGLTGLVTEVNNPSTGNIADVSIAGVGGNSSELRQNGIFNKAEISIARGGLNVTAAGGGIRDGLTFEGNRKDGNSSRILQTGASNSAVVSFGARAAGDGRGNVLMLDQGQGTATLSAPNQTNVAASASAIGREHSAIVYQFGQLSDVKISQDNNDSNGGAVGGVQYGSTADVSQSAFASIIQLVQLGRNTAVLSQGGGTSDSGSNTSGNNKLTVEQVQAGPNFNETRISQAGRMNSGLVLQNGSAASATLLQRRGSEAGQVDIRQGGGNGGGGYLAAFVTGVGAGASSNAAASIDQGGQRSVVLVRQDGSNLTVDVAQNARNVSLEEDSRVQISQVGSSNRSSVQQAGSSSSVAIDQRNSNSGPLQSIVEVTQSGGTAGAGNVAFARQTGRGSGIAIIAASAQTGPTGDPDTRLSGTTAANLIYIRQAGSLNRAEIEQQGAGQIGRIEQTGNNNDGRILQTAGATNSTAIIIQNGNGNVFGITQDRPNQFYRVVQGGTNNVVTHSGSSGGGTIGLPVFLRQP